MVVLATGKSCGTAPALACQRRRGLRGQNVGAARVEQHAKRTAPVQYHLDEKMPAHRFERNLDGGAAGRERKLLLRNRRRES